MSSKVVIVGGGVIGSSIAYFLAASDPTVSVTVIERDPTYARSSSALSAASIRQQFSTPLSIQMSLFGIEFLRSIGERLEIDGTKPSIDLHEGGYLFLATPAGEATLRENHALQKVSAPISACSTKPHCKRAFPGSIPKTSSPAPMAKAVRAGSTVMGWCRRCARKRRRSARAM